MGRGQFGQTHRRAADGTAAVSFPQPDLAGGFFAYLPWFALCDSGGATMDPPPMVAGGERRSCHYLRRCLLTFSLSVVLCFSLVFLFGFFAVSGHRFPVPRRPAAVTAQCKIVSSSVDIRSAEVCELGFLNFKAKNVLYGTRKNRFRCHHDYYWASVFEVEYKEFFSGETRYAYAEAPKEALPLNCRPSFGIAWLAKGRFKVNETYNCRYTPGDPTVDIHSDSIFDCEAENPSTVEMLKRYCILFESIMNSAPSPKAAGYLLKGAVTGVFSGILSSISLLTLIKLIQVAKLWLVRMSGDLKHPRAMLVQLRQSCFIFAYISAVFWLVFKYGKVIGIPEVIDQMIVSARRPR